MLFVSFNSNTTGATSGAGTAYSFGAPEFTTPSISVVRVTQSLVFCVMLCRSLLLHLSFFFRALCCLSFDLRISLTLLV